jgi:hypothetical protein
MAHEFHPVDFLVLTERPEGAAFESVQKCVARHRDRHQPVGFPEWFLDPDGNSDKQ